MLRPIATVSAGTLGSRLAGFARDALIAALLGAGGAADAFLLAFQFVNVARRALSEGALNAVLVPAYLRIGHEAGAPAAASFAGRALGTIGIAVFGAAMLLGIAMPGAIALLAPGFAGRPAFHLTVDAARLMLPYLAFAGPVAVMAAALNAGGRVALTSLSPALFNAAMIATIAALLFAGFDTARAALALAAAVGGAGCLQFGFLAISGTRCATPVRVAFDREMRGLFRRALPGMLAQSGPQLLFVAGAIAASASPAAVSWIYFAGRLVELPLGLVAAATGAVLIPRLSGAAGGAGGDPAAASSTALQLALGLALPASCGLALLAHPIVALLFERGAFTARDSEATAQALVILAISLPALVLAKPLGAIFFAREQIRQPVMATLVGLLATIASAPFAQAHHGHAGVAAAVALGAWTTAIWLAAALAVGRKRAIDAPGGRKLALIVLASALMGAALAAVQPTVPTGIGGVWARAVALGTLIAFGVLVYAAALRMLGVIEFRVIRRAFGRDRPPG